MAIQHRVRDLTQPIDRSGVSKARFRGEALGGQRPTLRVPQHLPDADLACVPHQGHAAALAAGGRNPSLAAEEMDHLRQVVLGNLERRRDFRDGGPAIRFGGQVDEHAQAVVGERGEFHGARGGVAPAAVPCQRLAGAESVPASVAPARCVGHSSLSA